MSVHTASKARDTFKVVLIAGVAQSCVTLRPAFAFEAHRLSNEILDCVSITQHREKDGED